MSNVEVHIGTKLGVVHRDANNLQLAADAIRAASNIASYHCIKECEQFPNDSSIPTWQKTCICYECAELIICCAQISMNVCEERPRSSFYVDTECFEDIRENSAALLHSTMRVLQLIDDHVSGPTLWNELWHSIRLACMISARVGETELAPCIDDCLCK